MAHIRLYSITPDGKQAILALIEPGELFGEPALVGSDAREEFAPAVGTSRVVAIPRDAMELKESSNFSTGERINVSRPCETYFAVKSAPVLRCD